MKPLKKSSRVVRCAYWYADEKNIPSTVSLCKLFWRSALGIPLGIVVCVMWVIIGVVMAVISVFLFLFGRRFVTFQKPNLKTGKDEKEIKVEHFETWPVIRGVRITPMMLVAPVTVLFGFRPAMLEGERYFEKTKFMPQIVGVRLPPVFYVTLVLFLSGLGIAVYQLVTEVSARVSLSESSPALTWAVFIAFFIVLAVAFFRSDFWTLTWEAAKATKSKVCPIIQLED